MKEKIIWISRLLSAAILILLAMMSFFSVMASGYLFYSNGYDVEWLGAFFAWLLIGIALVLGSRSVMPGPLPQ